MWERPPGDHNGTELVPPGAELAPPATRPVPGTPCSASPQFRPLRLPPQPFPWSVNPVTLPLPLSSAPLPAIAGQGGCSRFPTSCGDSKCWSRDAPSPRGRTAPWGPDQPWPWLGDSGRCWNQVELLLHFWAHNCLGRSRKPDNDRPGNHECVTKQRRHTAEGSVGEGMGGGAGTHDTSQRAGPTHPVPARCPLAWLRMEQRTPG